MSELFLNQTRILTSADIPNSYWNLLDGTADFSKISNNVYDGEKHSDVKTPAGNMSFHKTQAWNYPTFDYMTQKGKIYTFSFSVKFMKKMSGKMVVYSDPKFDILKQTDIDMPNEPLDTWIRPSYTIKSNVDEEISFGLASSVAGDTYVGDYMLNEGAWPLAWNYSLNDFKNKMEASTH